MQGSASLEGLRGLHQDLIALSNSQLSNIDRAWAELDAQLDDLKRLLEKTPKSEASRKKLSSGPLSPLSNWHVLTYYAQAPS